MKKVYDIAGQRFERLVALVFTIQNCGRGARKRG